ncbi:hypothetical protein FB567DRAFT_519184 [Paraphoma chrysanthemicola]|uniref:Uncharacterized protein n=1 Tax=Paraphoma chrysanthemicola TaxID=798071 RepID=A0A8K0W2W7_9PLEO|nr:hypothetical protein FB567DRAFT_519184 [Paraphoma chrysanthemicola]
MSGQINQYRRSTYHSSVIPYSIAWNQKFANKLQRCLPRELRNVVYRYLWDDNAMKKWTHGLGVYAAQKVEPCPDQPCQCCLSPTRTIPHFLQAVFVGPETAQETAETLYRIWPGGHGVQSPSLIKGYLFNDAFHAGYNPLRTFRQLAVTCKIDDFRTPRTTCNKKSGAYCKHTASERSYIKKDELEGAFEDLLSIPRKEGFVLHIIFEQRNLRLAVLVEALEAFRSVHDAFVAARAFVGTKWEYTGIGSGKPHLGVHDYYSKGASLDAWKAKMVGKWESLHLRRKLCLQHCRYTSEPSEDLCDQDFVHKMWEKSEEEWSPEDEKRSADWNDSETDEEASA